MSSKKAQKKVNAATRDRRQRIREARRGCVNSRGFGPSPLIRLSDVMMMQDLRRLDRMLAGFG